MLKKKIDFKKPIKDPTEDPIKKIRTTSYIRRKKYERKRDTVIKTMYKDDREQNVIPKEKQAKSYEDYVKEAFKRDPSIKEKTSLRNCTWINK